MGEQPVVVGLIIGSTLIYQPCGFALSKDKRSDMWGTEGRLEDYLRERLRRALDDLAGMAPDDLLSENLDVVVTALLDKHIPTEIVVDWDAPTRSAATEVSTKVRDQFDRDRIYTVPASKIEVSFPVTGSNEMLDYQASSSRLTQRLGKVTRGSIVLEIVERVLTPDVVREKIEALRRDITPRVGWANGDLSNFREAAVREIRAAHASRKERLLNDRAVEDALGIPLRATSAQRPPVAAHRKMVTLETRRVQSGFVPEPVLHEAIYLDILGVVRSWASSLERTPRPLTRLDEEDLRDLLLGNLNGYWRGAAGGELFNGSGKTDILVRDGDRNAFIGECKIWHGPGAVTTALDQLLSYLVWRDSKAALIMFIKTADPAATIARLHVAVESHPSCVLRRDSPDPSDRVDYVFTADDEGRRISLAVIPVVIGRGL